MMLSQSRVPPDELKAIGLVADVAAVIDGTAELPLVNINNGEIKTVAAALSFTAFAKHPKTKALPVLTVKL